MQHPGKPGCYFITILSDDTGSAGLGHFCSRSNLAGVEVFRSQKENQLRP